MPDTETSRLSRLSAILILLQSKRLVTASSIAQKFNISTRTAYRDIKALEEAGVPVITEEGRGYSLMPGYSLPPVMFSEAEANALITAEKWVITNKDRSFVTHYTDAITKIKAVLKYTMKDKAELLSERIHIRINPLLERTSNHLSTIQLAITNSFLLHIRYRSESHQLTERSVEPLALYSTQENWILIAYCRLRMERRAFRLDRMEAIGDLSEHFSPTPFSLQEYFEECRKNSGLVPLT